MLSSEKSSSSFSSWSSSLPPRSSLTFFMADYFLRCCPAQSPCLFTVHALVFPTGFNHHQPMVAHSQARSECCTTQWPSLGSRSPLRSSWRQEYFNSQSPADMDNEPTAQGPAEGYVVPAAAAPALRLTRPCATVGTRSVGA